MCCLMRLQIQKARRANDFAPHNRGLRTPARCCPISQTRSASRTFEEMRCPHARTTTAARWNNRSGAAFWTHALPARSRQEEAAEQQILQLRDGEHIPLMAGLCMTDPGAPRCPEGRDRAWREIAMWLPGCRQSWRHPGWTDRIDSEWTGDMGNSFNQVSTLRR